MAALTLYRKKQMALTKVTYAMIEGAPLSVLDYGADPTGVADSTSAIEAAIVAAQAKNVGITFPSGNYKITDGILVDPAISFTGQSDATISFVGTLPITAASAWLIFANGSNFKVSNLTFDGNARNGTVSGYGIQVHTCEDFEFSNNVFYDVYKGNLGLTNASAASNCKRVKIIKNTFVPLSSAAQEGIGITGVDFCLISDNIIDNPIDDAIALHGISIASAAGEQTCNQVTISNNIIGNNIYLSGLTGSGRLLLEGKCVNTLIVGNQFYGKNTNSYVALQFQNAITPGYWSEGYPINTTITGNRFEVDVTSTGNPAAILLSCQAHVDIFNNSFYNFFAAINVTNQPSGFLQVSNNIDISNNSFYTNRVTLCTGVSIGTYDPTTYPSIVNVDSNYFNFSMQLPIDFANNIDGKVAEIVFSNNQQTGATKFQPPTSYGRTGTQTYFDLNTNSWNYQQAIPIVNRWVIGSAIWNNLNPSSGNPPGWVCTASGVPGTWRAMANLA